MTLKERIESDIKQHPELSQKDKSKKINYHIRQDCIHLPKDYIETFRNSKYATIDPDKASFTDTDYDKINANSFGPFNPEVYFTLPEEKRIVWLLKEPYIEKDKWDKEGDRGGHDQADEYHYWEKIEAKTHEKLIKYTKILLEELGFIEKGKDDDETMNQVMNHICILEVNHFPGLAFKTSHSDDTLLKKWKEKNNDLIDFLIDFYNPGIVIGGFTLEHWGLDSFSDNFDKIKQHTLPLFNKFLVEWSYIEAGGSEIVSTYKWKDFDSLPMEKIKDKKILRYNVGRNIIYVGVNEDEKYTIDCWKQPRFYIQAYHPVHNQEFDTEYAKPDAKRINGWLKDWKKSQNDGVE